MGINPVGVVAKSLKQLEISGYPAIQPLHLASVGGGCRPTYRVPGAGATFTEVAELMCPARGAVWMAPRVLAT